MAQANGPTLQAPPKLTSAEKMDALKADLAASGTPIDKPFSFKSSAYSQESHSYGYEACLHVPAGKNWQDVLKPSSWTLAPKLIIGCKVNVRHELMEFYGEVIVVAADHYRNKYEVREILYRDLAPANVDEFARKGFSASYEGLTRKWVIKRDTDGHIMKEGIASREAAENLIVTEMVPTTVTSGLQLSR